jgi:hypothetical protein
MLWEATMLWEAAMPWEAAMLWEAAMPATFPRPYMGKKGL